MATEADQPAFAYQQWVGNEKIWKSGMTKREAFAMAAMEGMLANSECLKIMTKHLSPDLQASFLANASVEQADALIEALNKIKE